MLRKSMNLDETKTFLRQINSSGVQKELVNTEEIFIPSNKRIVKHSNYFFRSKTV